MIAKVQRSEDGRVDGILFQPETLEEVGVLQIFLDSRLNFKKIVELAHKEPGVRLRGVKDKGHDEYRHP
jgi:hypothetical protein